MDAELHPRDLRALRNSQRRVFVVAPWVLVAVGGVQMLVSLLYVPIASEAATAGGSTVIAAVREWGWSFDWARTYPGWLVACIGYLQTAGLVFCLGILEVVAGLSLRASRRRNARVLMALTRSPTEAM